MAASTSIELANRFQVQGWTGAFVVLAVRRCRPLLQSAGVPANICASPEALTGAARGYLLRRLEILNAPPGQRFPAGNDTSQGGDNGQSRSRDAKSRARARGAYYDRVESELLERAFAQLSRVYAEPDVRSLHDWAQRHFADISLRDRWCAWSVLFARLARRSFGSAAAAPVPESDRAIERLLRTARKEYEDAAPSHFVRMLKEALRANRSPLERALEEMYPYWKEEWGALGHAAEAVRSEQAYQTWRELEKALQPSDLNTLIRWGRDQSFRTKHWELLPALDAQLGVVSRYPCPCCGYYTFHKWPPGTISSDDTCPVCFWEDAIGANRVSLEEARRNFRAFGAKRRELRQFVRPPTQDELPPPPTGTPGSAS